MHTKFNLFLIILLLSVLTIFAIYAPTLQGGFHHDDIANLVANEKVKVESLSLDSLKEAATSSDAGKLKRPISMLSFALNYYFFGENSFSFRITNLLIHLIISALLLLTIFEIYKRINPDISSKATLYTCVICIIIWAVHPLQLSTVSYVVQRMTMLSALFTVLSIYLYILARASETTRKAISLYTISFISFVCGMLSKENAVLTPLFLILIEVFVIQPSNNNGRFNKAFTRFLQFAFTAAIIAGILSWSSILGYLNDWYSRSRDFTLEERLLTQPRVIFNYIKWYFIPNIQQLGLHHDDITISKSLLSPISTIFSISGILLFIIAAAAYARKFPLMCLGIAFFLTGHLLESSIIPLEMAYEHRNYLPSIGLVLIFIEATKLISKLFDVKVKKLMIIQSLIIVFLCSITYARALQWKDPLTFALYEVEHHPKSPRANHSLGMAYRSLVLNGEKQFKNDAYSSFVNAASIDSRHIQPEAALIKFSVNMGDPVSPDWINSIAKKISIYAPKLDYINILSELLLCPDNNCLLPKDAGEFLLTSIGNNNRITSSPLVYSSYASLKANYILERGGEISEAEDLLIKAIENAPHRINYHVDYANFLLYTNKPEAALEQLNNAYKFDKNSIHKDSLDQLKNIILTHPKLKQDS